MRKKKVKFKKKNIFVIIIFILFIGAGYYIYKNGVPKSIVILPKNKYLASTNKVVDLYELKKEENEEKKEIEKIEKSTEISRGTEIKRKRKKDNRGKRIY